MKNIKSKIKHIIKILIGREIFVKTNVKLFTKWYGNSRAGFYVYPALLNSNSIIYSFGVGEDISFDEELINEFNCTIYGFDPMPKSIQFIKNKQISPNFIFNPYGIFSYDGLIKFYLPINSEHVSCTTSKVWDYKNIENISIEVPVKKISTIIKDLGHNRIDILKLDIEGTEYEVLDEILNIPIEINQILIEFHHRFQTINKSQTKLAIKKLNAFGYKLAAISDYFDEFTFVKF